MSMSAEQLPNRPPTRQVAGLFLCEDVMTGRGKLGRCDRFPWRRPDLAGPALRQEFQPCLSSEERTSRSSGSIVRCSPSFTAKSSLVIIPRATHLFEEPGALDEVAQLACDWYQRYLIVPVQDAKRTATSWRGFNQRITDAPVHF
jgi:hypothetical protein